MNVRLYFFIILSSVPFFQNHLALGQTKDKCRHELRQAIIFFQAAKYDSALSLLNLCLVDRQLGPLEKAQAYKLLGKVKVASGNVAGAKAAFHEALSLQPFMELDPKQEAPEIIRIFEKVRIEFLTANPSTRGAKNWPWIAVSGAVVFTVAALLFFK